MAAVQAGRMIMLKIAITVWGNRISPVFDAAGTLLVAEIESHQIRHRQYLSFNPRSPLDLTRVLKKLDIDILVCGAISTKPANLIVSKDIKLISFVTGNVQQLLETFAKKQAIEKNFMMPGCSRQYSRRLKSKDLYH